MNKFSVVLLCWALGLVSTAVASTPRGRRARRGSDPTSLSIGTPSRGRLQNAALLSESDYVRYRSGTDVFRYGTDEMVYALEQAGKEVAARAAGASLTVGDISQRRGGRFRPHRSHRNGRDVDVAFYMTDTDGGVAYAERFVRFRRSGSARDRDLPLRFDDARNWAFLASMLMSDKAPVQHVFVSNDLKRRLLTEARRQGASEELLDRAQRVLRQPSSGGRHDDHFHMRIYCAPGDRPRCRDSAPFHPWLTNTAATAAVSPLPS